jgi:hypothetical protein
MADPVAAVTNTVTKAPSAFLEFFKKYWIFGVLLIVGIAIAALRYRDAIAKKAPAFVRNAARLGAYLLPLGLTLLLGSDALAAVTNACASNAPCGARAVGWFARSWQWIAGLASGGLAMAYFSAPDVLDGVNTNNGKSVTFTPDAAATTDFSMFIRCPQKRVTSNGAPLLAEDTTIAISTTIDNPSTGATIADDDLARLLNYVQIEVQDVGTVLDQKTGRGPILDLVISFFGHAFNRAGDSPIDAIAPPGSSTSHTAVTKYFTYPWKQRVLDNEVMTCPWLGILDETEFKMSWAKAGVLNAVSTGSTYSGATTKVRMGTSYFAHPLWFQPMFAKYVVDEPASGSDGLVFQSFGGANPAGTVPSDLVFLIGQLSSLKGLPGNITIDQITKLIAPSFGIDDLSNIDMLVKERLQSQLSGRTPDITHLNGGNYVMGAGDVGMQLNQLLFFNIRQPSLHMQIQNMLQFGSGTKLPVREEFSATRTGADAFIVGSLRALAEDCQKKIKAKSGGKMPVGKEAPKHFIRG